MKYTGNPCAGCGKVFTDDDDIVVCPECGTPQHRECYDKENRCVCEALHFEEYTWHGTVNNENASAKAEKSETVSCPNCGYENPKGTDVCKQCGMKFTFFGMNVVDALAEEEKRVANQNSDIPDYKAPFTLGTGKGFEQKDLSDTAPIAKEVEELLTNVLTGNTENNTENGGRLNLGGPFPPEDEIGGVMTNNIGNFIGSNAMTYISKFRKLEKGKKLSFNFAAFFFSPYWFFFRKLYKAGIVVMTVIISLTILVTPYLNIMIELLERFGPVLEAGTMTEAQFTEFYGEFVSASVPMIAFYAAVFLIQLICGFIANPLYKKYVIENAAKAERMESKTAAISHIVKYGGASILIAGASYFVYQILTMIVSSML